MPHVRCGVGTESANEPPAQTTVVVSPGAAPLASMAATPKLKGSMIGNRP
jgi:hypothetical protein